MSLEGIITRIKSQNNDTTAVHHCTCIPQWLAKIQKSGIYQSYSAFLNGASLWPAVWSKTTNIELLSKFCDYCIIFPFLGHYEIGLVTLMSTIHKKGRACLFRERLINRIFLKYYFGEIWKESWIKCLLL